MRLMSLPSGSRLCKQSRLPTSGTTSTLAGALTPLTSQSLGKIRCTACLRLLKHKEIKNLNECSQALWGVCDEPAAGPPLGRTRPWRAGGYNLIFPNEKSQRFIMKKKYYLQIRPLQSTRLTRFCSLLSWRFPGDVQFRRNALERCKSAFKCQYKRIQCPVLGGSHPQPVERDHVRPRQLERSHPYGRRARHRDRQSRRHLREWPGREHDTDLLVLEVHRQRRPVAHHRGRLGEIERPERGRGHRDRARPEPRRVRLRPPDPPVQQHLPVFRRGSDVPARGGLLPGDRPPMDGDL